MLDKAIDGRENMYAVTVDIDDVAAIAALSASVIARFPALNVLVNNAGTMRGEALDSAHDPADAQTTITTNLLGRIRRTNALVDHLAVQGMQRSSMSQG